MIKTFIFILVLLNTRLSFSKSLEDKNLENVERWSKLMTLINKEIQTINSNKYSGPELKHRQFELYSEKIKLIKEKENLNLLNSNPKDIAQKGKESYFRESKKQFEMAQKLAYDFMKEYPKYEKLNEIYYASAINSRDFGNGLETENLLKLSLKNSNESSKTLYYAKIALAEFYYNNKKYKEAISYYQDLLKRKKEEWYGKHLYNASWCYLKERNFKKALELMKESFETTKDIKYVSMKEQINNSIGIFYVQADATKEGIEFYEKNTNPSAPWLLSLASSSMSKNNFTITEEVLRAALKDTQKRKDRSMEIKVRLVQLDIYRENKKNELFYETANSILDLNKKGKLLEEDLGLAVNKIKEVAGFMQISLVKDKTKEEVTFSKDDYKKIMRYFDILSGLDKKNKNNYRYYQGETALSTHDYLSALKYYSRSIMNSKISKDNGEVTRKSLEAMLSTLEFAKLSKQKEYDYTIFAFKNYLIFYPKSEKSQAIYQKTFNKYFEAHRLKKSINILLVYIYNYKEDIKIHREMLTQVLDTYIKEKNTDKIAFWINKIENGYLNFEQDYIQNSIAILGGLLFEKYQSLEKNGQYKEAMRGYENIYDSKKYPKRTKAESAYAIATLFQLQNNVSSSYKWIKKSLDLYEDKELLKLTSSLLNLAKGYRLLQSFDLSFELSALISRRFCGHDFESKIEFYSLLLTNSLIEEKSSKKILKIEDEFKNCHIKDISLEKSQQGIFERFISIDNSKEITNYFTNHKDNEKLVKPMSNYLKYKFWQANEIERNALEKEYTALIASNPKLEIDSMLFQYDRIQEFREKSRSLRFNFTNLPQFDEEKFNSELEQYFSIINALNNEAISLAKDSTPEEILLMREVLSGPYYSLVNSIKSFIPQGVDNKYLNGFRLGMRQITESLISKGLQVDREKMEILSKNNFFLEVQKHDKFENIRGQLASQNGMNTPAEAQNNLKLHSAILFSNTIDLNRGFNR